MRSFLLATCVHCAAAAPVLGALVAPLMTVNTATVTKDPLFSASDHNPVVSVESGTDPDGFARRRETATASIDSTHTVTTESGGGTRHMINSYSWEAGQRERVVEAAGDFRFDATTAIVSTIASDLWVSTYGNFFFVSYLDCTTEISLTRTIRFSLDGPMQLQVHFSGATSSDDFKGMFNNLQLRGGEFRPFVDMIYVFSLTAYQAADTTVFSGGGSKLGVDYGLSGTADSSGIDLVLDLSPSVPGTTPLVEFNWLIRDSLVAAVGPSAGGWHETATATANVLESVRLTSVPEPGTLALATLGLAAMAARRRTGARTAR